MKRLDPAMFTKSGIMVGLGEERGEVLQVMDDLRAAQVDFLTIGQYLQPTPKHHPVARFVTPDEFDGYRRRHGKGFLMVSASPLTRSSYHAGDDFARLRAARAASTPRLRTYRQMPTHAEQKVLPYTPEQLFALVADIERYPEFLPWCVGARIRERRDTVILADLIIGFRMFRERFTSRVTLNPPHRIDVAYTEGPFKIPE